jgi:hypothetical protein
VTGRFVLEGGPVRPDGKTSGPRPLPGTAEFTRAGHRPVTVQIGSSGRFSVQLPPGWYSVAERSPHMLTSEGSSTRELWTPPDPSRVEVTVNNTTMITFTYAVP